MEHEAYHEITIALLETTARLLSEIHWVTQGMLGVFAVASLIIIWVILKK